VETGEIIEVDLSVIRKISPLEWNIHVSFELLVCEEENPPQHKTAGQSLSLKRSQIISLNVYADLNKLLERFANSEQSCLSTSSGPFERCHISSALNLDQQNYISS
jgi:hypothetical protein